MAFLNSNKGDEMRFNDDWVEAYYDNGRSFQQIASERGWTPKSKHDRSKLVPMLRQAGNQIDRGKHVRNDNWKHNPNRFFSVEEPINSWSKSARFTRNAEKKIHNSLLAYTNVRGKEIYIYKALVAPRNAGYECQSHLRKTKPVIADRHGRNAVAGLARGFGKLNRWTSHRTGWQLLIAGLQCPPSYRHGTVTANQHVHAMYATDHRLSAHERQLFIRAGMRSLGLKPRSRKAIVTIRPYYDAYGHQLTFSHGNTYTSNLDTGLAYVARDNGSAPKPKQSAGSSAEIAGFESLPMSERHLIACATVASLRGVRRHWSIQSTNKLTKTVSFIKAMLRFLTSVVARATTLSDRAKSEPKQLDLFELAKAKTILLENIRKNTNAPSAKNVLARSILNDTSKRPNMPRGNVRSVLADMTRPIFNRGRGTYPTHKLNPIHQIHKSTFYSLLRVNGGREIAQSSQQLKHWTTEPKHRLIYVCNNSPPIRETCNNND